MSNLPEKSPDKDADQGGPGIWIAAAILIGVGVVFLLQNPGYAIPGNWWALFLLIPAAFALWTRGTATSRTAAASGPAWRDR